jgi:acyl carrier protein
MDEMEQRLLNCFQTVFAGIDAAAARVATPATVAGWDSVASIKLLNVIEEEFQIEIDLDQISELDSFPRILEYLRNPPAAV